MVKQLGAEYVKEKIDGFDMEVKKMCVLAIAAAEDADSSDED